LEASLVTRRHLLALARVAALPAVLFVTVAAPAVASAGTVSVAGNQVTYVAAPGETNDVRASGFSEDEMPFVATIDDSVPLTIAPGSPCEIDFFDDVRCVLPAPPSFNLQLGDGNDSGNFFSTFLDTTNALDGGPGDDRLSATTPRARNTISGGEGNDLLIPENGTVNPVSSDLLSGGPGVDTVAYDADFARRSSGVTVSLDGVANDGAPGEQDNVQPEVENLSGTSFSDMLVGGPGANELLGFGGNDVLSGGGGDDRLLGFGENDMLSGGDGNDFLEGGSEDDRLDGGAGLDSFIGDFSGSANQIIVGNDSILARDGVQGEPISCGPGSDSAIVDAGDNVNADPQNLCEAVDRAAAGPGPGGPAKGCKALKKGAKRDRCVYRAALKKCGKVKRSKRRTQCVKKAKRAYALKKCTRVKKGKRAKCIRKAKRAPR